MGFDICGGYRNSKKCDSGLINSNEGFWFSWFIAFQEPGKLGVELHGKTLAQYVCGLRFNPQPLSNPLKKSFGSIANMLQIYS